MLLLNYSTQTTLIQQLFRHWKFILFCNNSCRWCNEVIARYSFLISEPKSRFNNYHNSLLLCTTSKMSSPSDDKVRANRGQKRNFSFESHATSSVAVNVKESALSSASSMLLPVGSENDRFDIASLVTEIERTVECGAGTEPDIAEESLTDQVSCFYILCRTQIYFGTCVPSWSSWMLAVWRALGYTVGIWILNIEKRNHLCNGLLKACYSSHRSCNLWP